jgi:hypothetical protein
LSSFMARRTNKALRLGSAPGNIFKAFML